MVKAAERAGKANIADLVRQGRLTYNQTRGLDPNPNPEVGNVPNPDNGMRAGMTPEKYHRMVLLSERRRRLGKEWDFVPVLEDHEWDIYLAWLKSGGAKNMKAVGREAARAQTQDVMQLLRQHDPENAAKLDAVPAHPMAQQRDTIGTIGAPESVEENLTEAAEAVEDLSEDEIPDVSPEGQPVNSDIPPGYEPVDPDADVGEPEVVSAPRRRKRRNT